MKYFAGGIVFVLYLSTAAAASSVNKTLDTCLIPARNNANSTLFAEIDTCAQNFNNCYCSQSVCITIAKLIIHSIISSGVRCCKNLQLSGVSTAVIDTIVNELDVKVQGWIDDAEQRCFYGTSSIPFAVQCFKTQVSTCAQQAVDFIKAKALTLGVKAA